MTVSDCVFHISKKPKRKRTSSQFSKVIGCIVKEVSQQEHSEI